MASNTTDKQQKFLDLQRELFQMDQAHEGFSEPLLPFQFDEHLTLWAIPFDLDTNHP